MLGGHNLIPGRGRRRHSHTYSTSSYSHAACSQPPAPTHLQCSRSDADTAADSTDGISSCESNPDDRARSGSTLSECDVAGLIAHADDLSW
jgi:hypothetical protein